MNGVLVLILSDCVADGSVFFVGDRVTVSGDEAARLVRVGHAELVKQATETATTNPGDVATLTGGEVR